ncbi:hypothetical protein AJ79_05013 [Helicocarpus griseus UAMH5409]|uniref:FYVE-type domain-containing protein n=1 Tax=Helicocarpus griseus UAMH5409 TaxID=1447875 RepID=A0A2B7XQY0_9EURO|nr:hypothetical protein AJ79_05013 [Helicocarpus griseus UAMH5409]
MSSPASGRGSASHSTSSSPSVSSSSSPVRRVSLPEPTSAPAPAPAPALVPVPTSSFQEDFASASQSQSQDPDSELLRRTRTTSTAEMRASRASGQGLGESQGAGSPRHTLLEFLRSTGPDEDVNDGQDAGETTAGIRDTGTAAGERKRLRSVSDNAAAAAAPARRSTTDTGLRARPGPSAIPSWRRGSSGLPGSSRDNAIDLSGSQESVSRQINSLRHRENSFTDYELPRWQPDSEVSECPICNTPFSFWYRKHHCRKCGRVVCASCSPHRITIPRQFIVRPPESNRPLSTILQPNPSEVQVISLIDDDEDESSAAPDMSRGQRQQQRGRYPPNSALGGGEEVRLCNPCVPDPNPEPPRRYNNNDNGAADSLLSGSGRLSSTLSTWAADATGTGISHRPPTHRHSALPDYYRHADLFRTHANPFHRPSASLSSAANMPPSQAARDLRRQRGRGMIFQPETPEIQQAAQQGEPDEGLPSYGSFDYTVVPSFRGMPPRYQFGGGPHPHQSPPAYSSPSGTSPSSSRHRNSYPFPHAMPSHHRGASNDLVQSHSTSTSASRNRPLPLAPAHYHQHRPRIDERDICPVCNRILPPRAADGSEAAREAHVRACIEGHGQSGGAGAGGRRSSPSQQIDASNNNGNNVERPPLRMLPFTATEKDCVGEDGGPQECTICMEEYEVGDSLARLECLCKFHKRCIVEWLERKMECPVHKVD